MIDEERRILMSIKPRFADAILSGIKTVELRRSPPRVVIPTEVLLYASQPTSAIVGMCRVTEVLAYTPVGLWRLVGGRTGVTYAEFCQYFTGCTEAYGLVLTHARRLQASVGLSALRGTWEGFHPPQSYRYLTRESSDHVLAMAD